jgi:hypothetical protein
MDWYCGMTDHLLKTKYIRILDNQSYDEVLRQLEGRVVDMYKALLLYQMRSVCSYFGKQGWRWVRNLINLDDWAAQLDEVKAAEAAVKEDSKQYNNSLGLDMMGKLVTDGEETQKILGSFHQTFKDFVESQAKMQMDKEDDDCLKDLYRIDPQSQIATIESKKEKLFPAAYKWILDTDEYHSLIDWSDSSQARVLWLNGPAGTGKTMLMLGIISEIYEQSCYLYPGISYFFCQAQEEENSAIDTLRSLIWLLLIQQPHLLSHLTETHKRSGARMFNNPNAFFLLAKTFVQMLEDDRFTRVYLAFDALDECAPGKPGVQDLLNIVSETLKMTGKAAGKVKWIISSRPEVGVPQRLGRNKSSVMELDVQNHVEPVNAYIAYKLSELQETLSYTEETLKELETEICTRAQNTYLWAALVFRVIIDKRMTKKRALKEIQNSPADIFALYDRMMAHIDEQDEEYIGYCKNLLAAVCFASRPLSFAEVHVLAGLPSDVESDEIILLCGSFLVVRDEKIYMLHNTTHEYLRKHFASRQDEINSSMLTRSIDAMSKGLRYNIFDLQPGSESADIKPSRDDDLAPLQYSCEFWVDHLQDHSESLSDDGPVLEFLGVHFLHWAESLSLIHKAPKVLSSIRTLLSKGNVSLTLLQ